MLWSAASADDLAVYKAQLDNNLINLSVPVDALYCQNLMCDKHSQHLNIFHDSIIKACLHASNIIPCTQAKTFKCVPGWSEFVKEHKERALFWHSIWKSCGSPKTGVVSDIRRRTRSQYHRALRRVKQHKIACSSNKMAESLAGNSQRDFWSEVRRIRGTGLRVPDNVDDVNGSENISEHFLNKYDELYNSVSYDQGEMDNLKDTINNLVSDHCVPGNCVWQSTPYYCI